jgi:hypothetical protein
MNSGFFFTSSATALNSSASQLGCTPSSASNETTVRWRRSTTASHSFSFWRTTAKARRGKSAPAAVVEVSPPAAASKRQTASFAGSWSVTIEKRVSLSTLPEACRTSSTVQYSWNVSGSSGCFTTGAAAGAADAAVAARTQNEQAAASRTA